jgi:alkaline phosphatase D
MRRRDLLLGTGSVMGFLLAAQAQHQPSPAPPVPSRSKNYPFALGVASGEPQPDSIVLWTRLAVDPMSDRPFANRAVPVQWQIARDPQFRQVVGRGTATAVPEFAHAVHVVASGLDPSQWYWYQFKIGNEVSPVGRTRTAPALNAALDKLQFAFVSCQNYEQGYFNAYRYLSQENLDFVLHLGDYIYEGGGVSKPGLVRLHATPPVRDLSGYRKRYAQYRLDPDLQEVHRLFPFICTWDDHEVDNDYANAQSETFENPTQFLRRRAAAYQAYYEHLPLRPESKPKDANLQLYRRFQFGDLITLNVLDTRQYRDDQACGNGEGGGKVVVDCQERLNPRRSLLGNTQEQWLLEGLGKSKTRWNVIAQQYLVSELKQGNGYWSDGWDGYAPTRQRILQFLQTSRVANPIFLGGDIHSFWVSDLKLDFQASNSPIIASEFVGTSISSKGISYDLVQAFLPQNPHIKFFESRLRGYVKCTVTRDRWLSDLQVVDTVKKVDSTVRTLASFSVQAGKAGLKRV